MYHVPATGEVRVEATGTRLTINSRRKDATRELADLVVALEANPAPRPRQVEAPPVSRLTAVPIEDPMPDPNNRAPGDDMTFADRLRLAIRSQPKIDSSDWYPYDSASLARKLGVTSTKVAYTVNYWSKSTSGARVELRRDPTSTAKRAQFVAIRFVGKRKETRFAGADRMVAPVSVEPPPPRRPTIGDRLDEPAPRQAPQPAPEYGILPTPKLATYAEARKLATANPMLRAEPSPSEAAEILSEAVRLYWYVRKGSKE